jgi:hypothetical protein
MSDTTTESEIEKIDGAECADARLTECELDLLETRLRLSAYVRGWLGDPLIQPAYVVEGLVRQIVAERSPTERMPPADSLNRVSPC